MSPSLLALSVDAKPNDANLDCHGSGIDEDLDSL
jgi:hypothetical protein